MDVLSEVLKVVELQGALFYNGEFSAPWSVRAASSHARLDDLADYLSTALDQLVHAGADFAFIAANTPHLVFDELQRRSPIPLLSIVRATTNHAKALGLARSPVRNRIHHAR